MSTVRLNATTVNTGSYIENENAKTFIQPTVSGITKQERASMRIKQIGTNANKNIEYCQLAIKKEESKRLTRSKTAKKATGEYVESQNIPNSNEQILKDEAVISIPVPQAKSNTAESKKTLKATQENNVILKKHLLSLPALNTRANMQFKANEKKPMTPVASKMPVIKNNKCTPTQSSLVNKNTFSTKSPSALTVSQAVLQEKLVKNQKKRTN